MKILKTPNLPKNKVSHVLISSDALISQNSLKKLDIIPILSNKCQLFDKPIQSHADMSFLHIKDNKCIVQESNDELVKKITNIGFDVYKTKNKYSNVYPNDVGINFAIIGNYLIGRLKSIDKTLLELCEEERFEIIDVNQGYSKCSICIIDENSIITEDESIYKALKNKIDVLKIDSNSVILKGYNYGFLGGCAGLISKKTLAINGDIKTHKNYSNILNFITNRDVNFISLKSGYLEDIGSILPLIEV